MRPSGPRSHLICGQRAELAILDRPRPVPLTPLGYSRRLVKTYRRLKHIGPKVTVAQWLTALLVVVMMLQHYTRFVPFPEGAPAHGADFACRPDQLQCPRRMGLIDNISRNRRLSNGYRHTTDLGHRMKWNQEAENK